MSFGQFFWASSSCGYLKFPSLGGPYAGEKIKKHPLGGSQRGGNRSPGRPGLRMAAKLFEIEMQITCTRVKKTNSYVCKLLSPCDGPKKPAVWAATPREAGVSMYTHTHIISYHIISYHIKHIYVIFCMSVYLSIYLSICLSIYPSIYLHMVLTRACTHTQLTSELTK